MHSNRISFAMRTPASAPQFLSLKMPLAEWRPWVPPLEHSNEWSAQHCHHWSTRDISSSSMGEGLKLIDHAARLRGNATTLGTMTS